jgi:tetratricopeptide (TPR) repeat protein
MSVKKQKLLQKADDYAKEKKLKKAISLYREAIKEDGTDIRTRLRLSELLYQAGRLEEALEALQFVGNYYKEHGFLLKSVAVYKKMLEVDPSKTDLHGTLAQLFFQLGMAPDAIRQFKAQVKSLVKQGKHSESLFVLRSMLELDAANLPDRLRLAESFSAAGMIDEAAIEYRRALALLEKANKTREWMQVAARYLHHSPMDYEVRTHVVEILVKEGDCPKALQHLQACLQNEPDSPRLLDLAASCFEMLGQPEKAIVALKSMAAVLHQKGLSREEHDAYAHVLQLDPKDAKANASLGLLKEKEPEEEDIDLEWDAPADRRTPPRHVEDEQADTSFEPPSFAEELARIDEPTVVEQVSEAKFEELLEEADMAERKGIDVVRIRRFLDGKQPMTPAQLEACGIKLPATDKEELEFFLSSGLRDEALAVIQEIYTRMQRGA